MSSIVVTPARRCWWRTRPPLAGASYALIRTLFPAVVVRIAGPGIGVKAITVIFTATSLGTAFGAPLLDHRHRSAGGWPSSVWRSLCSSSAS